jgi:hypothetical protein
VVGVEFCVMDAQAAQRGVHEQRLRVGELVV